MKTAIHIEYDAVTDDGGSPVTSYNVYVDNGSGTFTSYTNALATTYNTGSLGLTAGTIYMFKYSAVNMVGEGPLSDDISIMQAQVPGVPTSFARVDEDSL